ncbi:50S ribosomal protein L5 [bacterium]|nr:50S ribosomal protein L5 [bacterium]
MEKKTYLEKMYEKIKPELVQILNIKNSFRLPRLQKAVVNVGLSDNRFEPQKVEEIKKNINLILGQTPAESKAKKSIAGFKVREGQVVGFFATLRGKKMYAFLDKLFNIVLPRQRDFRGVRESCLDKEGILHIGLEDYTLFPDISPEEVKTASGLSVDIVTTAANRKEAKVLFEKLGIVFESEEARRMREEAAQKAKEEAKIRAEKIRIYKQQAKEVTAEEAKEESKTEE